MAELPGCPSSLLFSQIFCFFDFFSTFWETYPSFFSKSMDLLKLVLARQSTLLHPLGTSSCPVGSRGVFPTLLGHGHASCLTVSSAQLPASSAPPPWVVPSPRASQSTSFLLPALSTCPLLLHYSFLVEAAGLLCVGVAVAGASAVSAT